MWRVFLARADFVACSSCNWEDPLGRERCQVSSIPIAKIENRCPIFFIFFLSICFFQSPPPPFFPLLLLQFSKCNAGADKTTRLVLVLRSMAFGVVVFLLCSCFAFPLSLLQSLAFGFVCFFACLNFIVCWYQLPWPSGQRFGMRVRRSWVRIPSVM